MTQAKISLIEDIQVLTQRDPDLAQIIDTLGYPSQWQREPGFATLIQIILEQQVSLASAQATFKRLNDAVDKLTPETFLSLDEAVLKVIGFSRQKITYGRELAQAITRNIIDLDSFVRLDNFSIRRKLTSIKGIGDWTVDMYLMMALQRQDIFPTKDLAVKIAVQEIKNLPTRPQPEELQSIAEQWRPYRAIATKILWHYYLNRKSNKGATPQL